MIALKPLIPSLLDLAYPPECLICAAPVEGSIFCDRCDQQLQPSGSPCPRCGYRYPTMPPQAVNCPHCQNEDFAFCRTTSLGTYDAARRSAVLLMKDLRNEALAHAMGCRLAAALRDVQADVVIPVPLHWTRRLWRGYNQAAVLAQAVATTMLVPCARRLLWRRMQTPMQSSITPTQRRRNLRDAMQARVPKAWKGKRALLVDDVMTTGATADACARALLAAGLESVEVAVIARAIGDA